MVEIALFKDVKDLCYKEWIVRRIDRTLHSWQGRSCGQTDLECQKDLQFFNCVAAVAVLAAFGAVFGR